MTTRRASAVLLLVSALVVAAGVVAPSASAARRTTASIRVSQPKPVANERLVVSGRVSTRFRRPVTLQVKTAGRAWRPLRRGTTTARGVYRFPRVSTARVVSYSVLVPSVRHGGRSYGKAVTRARRVAPVRQSAAVDVLPGVAQGGRTLAASTRAAGSVVASFTPARPGRTVVFSRLGGNGRWATAGRARQGADGRAYWFGATSTGTRPLAFRAKASARAGARAVTSGSGVGDWQATFADEFSGSTLDLSKWHYRNGRAPSRTKSTNDPRAVSVSGGALRLHVMRDPASPATMLLSSQIATTDSLLQRYGVFSARMKFPQERGQHGSLWLQSPTYGAFPGNVARSGAEVDVVESFGRGAPGGGLASFLYFVNGAGRSVQYGGVQPQARSLIPRADTWYNSYHVFSVRWTPSRYTMYVDGRVLFTSTDAVSQRTQYVILSLLASDWELKHLDRTRLPSEMSVDWAKVWQSRSLL